MINDSFETNIQINLDDPVILSQIKNWKDINWSVVEKLPKDYKVADFKGPYWITIITTVHVLNI